MRSLKLKTQLSLVIGLLGLYSVTLGVSYYFIQHKAQAELQAVYENDLNVMVKLYRLSDELRYLQLLRHGEGSSPARAAEESGVIRDIRALAAETAPYFSGSDDQRLWNEVGSRLELYLGARKSRSSAGAGSDAWLLSTVRAIITIKDAHFQRVQRRKRTERRVAKIGFFATLGSSFLIVTLVALALFRYVIAPITRLESYTSQWELGTAWSLDQPPSAPEIDSLLARLKDMTRRLNEQFEREQETSRFKSQMVSLVSHEFNNALMVISNAATLLADGEQGGSSPERATFYRVLEANARALNIAVKNLLNLGRVEEGKFIVEPRALQVKPIAEQTVERLELLARRKSITIAVVADPDVPSVRADPDAMALVFANLISNAVKYTPEKGTVTVRISRLAGGVRVCVQDSGIGISQEDRAKIFGGFYRAAEGKRAAQGFGIGLTIVKRALEAHGTTIELDSIVGKGSTFWFSLPAVG